MSANKQAFKHNQTFYTLQRHYWDKKVAVLSVASPSGCCSRSRCCGCALSQEGLLTKPCALSSNTLMVDVIRR